MSQPIHTIQVRFQELIDNDRYQYRVDQHSEHSLHPQASLLMDVGGVSLVLGQVVQNLVDNDIGCRNDQWYKGGQNCVGQALALFVLAVHI